MDVRSHLSLTRKYAQTIGWKAAVDLHLYDVLKANKMATDPVISLQLGNASFPVHMRTGRSSDRDVLQEVFITRQYDTIELLDPKMILDLGAYVGYTSVRFLSKYPKVRVLAVEPDPENFHLCCQNLASFHDRAICVLGAVWLERTRLRLCRGAFRDGREWTTQVERGASPDVEAYDVPSLIEACGVNEIDLVKIDIEGAESELFGRSVDGWLPRVRNLCIELHNADCERVFFQALAGYRYDLSRDFDLNLCRNIIRI
jgi:FkbM family methyltransferase